MTIFDADTRPGKVVTVGIDGLGLAGVITDVTINYRDLDQSTGIFPMDSSTRRQVVARTSLTIEIQHVIEPAVSVTAGLVEPGERRLTLGEL